jgi:hypothetical protein
MKTNRKDSTIFVRFGMDGRVVFAFALFPVFFFVRDMIFACFCSEERFDRADFFSALFFSFMDLLSLNTTSKEKL